MTSLKRKNQQKRQRIKRNLIPKNVHPTTARVACEARTMKLLLNGLSRFIAGEPITNPSTMELSYSFERESQEDLDPLFFWSSLNGGFQVF